MTRTVLSSATREVAIGFDRPFVIIGERINPTGRKLLAEEMKAGDYSRVIADAQAQVPDETNILRLLGLETKQKALGGPGRAAEVGKRLLDRQGPDGRRVVESLMEKNPAAGLAWTRAQLKETGSKLGGVRDELAARGASVRAQKVLDDFSQLFEDLPSDARMKAIEYIRGLVGDLSDPAGSISSRAVRKIVEDAGRGGYSTGLLETSMGDRAKDVYRQAYRVFSDYEKGLVREVVPEMADDYLRALADYRDLKHLRMGANVKLGRLQQGMDPVNLPRAKDVPVPEQLPRPLPPAMLEPLEPALRPLPDPVYPPVKPQGMDDLAQFARERGGVRARMGGAVGALLVKQFAGSTGQVTGREIGYSLAQALQKHSSGIPNKKLADMARTALKTVDKVEKAGEAIGPWQPILVRAATEGPQAFLAAHQMLLSTAPEYARVIEGAPQDVKVEARMETEDSPAPPEKGPKAPKEGAPKKADVQSNSVLDTIVLQSLRNDPPNRNDSRERGWLLRGDGDRNLVPMFEDIGVGLGKRLTGERDSVPFQWKSNEDIRATVHTHPQSRGSVASNSTNHKNRSASPWDHDLVNVGKVPAYVVGTDGNVRVLERVGGEVVERVVGSLDEVLDRLY